MKKLWKAIRTRASRLWLRLLAFNVLLVFLPLLGVFLSEAYERQLADRQERAMVQQGRLLSAALGGQGELNENDVRLLLLRLQGRTRARLRVLDKTGRVVGDTAVLGPQKAPEVAPEGESEAQQSLLYQLGAFPFRIAARFRPSPPPPEATRGGATTSDVYQGPEVEKALLGEYGAATRTTQGGQRSLTFYSAIPIRNEHEIVGAALVSQSTYYILRDLYDIRLAIFKVFLVSLIVAIVLSLLVSTTIATPLRRLREEAASLLDARGRLRGRFEESTRADEIGDLTRALGELSRRLSEHQAYTESFAADLSHEFKNPLASIRSATEILSDVSDLEQRAFFVRMIQSDTARLERLLSSLREITSIDAGSDSDETELISLNPLCKLLIEGWTARHGQKSTVSFEPTSLPVTVRTSPHRFGQVLENLLSNAASFSPEGAEISCSTSNDGHHAILEIRDQGPGIPDGNLDRIFDRFFSYRPSEASGTNHSGLGLAIVKAIAESYGGSVSASNNPEGGATFRVALPLVDKPPETLANTGSVSVPAELQTHLS